MKIKAIWAQKNITIRTAIFSLNNFKRKRGAFEAGILDGKQLNVDTFPAAEFFWYEVQVEVDAPTLAQAKNVIISMLPKSFSGNLVAAQRLIHNEQ